MMLKAEHLPIAVAVAVAVDVLLWILELVWVGEVGGNRNHSIAPHSNR